MPQNYQNFGSIWCNFDKSYEITQWEIQPGIIYLVENN